MKKRVFLLEDDASLASLIKLKLERAGFDVISFLTAGEAYDYISADPEGVLLADYYLPDTTCDELINKLLDNKIKIPFVVTTGVNDKNLGVEIMKSGASDFIIKNLGFIDTLPVVMSRTYESMLINKELEQSIENIKQNELKLRIFFENIQDIFFVLDKYGRVIEISPASEKLVGYTTQEITNKRIKKYFARKNEFNSLIEELQSNTNTISKNIKVRHKSGKIVYLSVSCRKTVLNSNDIRILGIAQNISDKRLNEAEVIKKVLEAEERERKKLVEAIHDDLGPMMSAIKMYSELIFTTREDIEKQEKLKKDISEVIDSTIQKTRAITANLTSNVLDMHGLKPAIESFAEKICFASGINFDLQIAHKEISKAMEVFLYRAAVELINNTVKHSGASEVSIIISQTTQNLIFQYRDNGCGFDSELLTQPGKVGGHGLLSIINKVSMMSGNSSIVSSINSGMQVKISFDNNLI